MTWLRRLLGRSGTPSDPPELIVVGLGNPGPEYANTRHNVGFRCVELLAERHDINLGLLGKVALAGFGAIHGHPTVLSKPLTFVNRSGLAFRALLEEYEVEPPRFLVIYDEMDLEPGTLRLRAKGSSGGHNGMRSIIKDLSTQDFPRIRIGVGRPVGRSDTIDHVLGAPSREEGKLIDEAVERAAEAVSVILSDGVDVAMNRFN